MPKTVLGVQRYEIKLIKQGGIEKNTCFFTRVCEHLFSTLQEVMW